MVGLVYLFPKLGIDLYLCNLNFEHICASNHRFLRNNSQDNIEFGINMKNIEVVAAVIFRAGNVLCVQRPENAREYVSMKWEFPGGKIEVGESREDALVREIEEELAVDINWLQYLMTLEHSYPDFHLTMPA